VSAGVPLALDVIEVCRVAQRALERDERDAKEVGDAKALISLREQRDRVVRLLNWAVTQAESPNSEPISKEISSGVSNARASRR